MPQLRPDALLVPKVSWTQNDAPAAVSYGALVGTPQHIILLPRTGTETAGFTLSFQWTPGAATADDIAQVVGDQAAPIGQIEQTLIQSLPAWQTRCAFPLDQLSRFEILKGWKLWLGVSAVLQIGNEPATALRVPNKTHLNELRQLYAQRLG
ncbi:MAG: hypothetical protein JRI68_04745 [Deltaproteobacteria bacterium]|nr:hypothetical protein [Deltaproteobacteria bacterium]